MRYKQVIIVRKDLNMRKGKMIAQGAHAAVNVVEGILTSASKKDLKRYEAWKEDGTAKICVGAESEAVLVDAYNKAREKGLPCAIIRDAGLTEFGGVPTLTACAIGPADESEIDPITGELKLL